MTTILPGDVTFGTVTGKFLLGIDDGADADDLPDSQPASGTVTFTPMASAEKYQGATPPFTLLPQPVVVALGADGSFSRKLISTDNVNGNPVDWTWAVAFAFDGGVKYNSFTFELPAGSTVDLTVVAPVGSSGGNNIIRGPGVPDGGTAGQLLRKLTSTDDDTAWVDPVRPVTLTGAANVYTPDAASMDVALIVVPTANFTVANPTGTPKSEQRLIVKIRCTTARTPSWGTQYASSGVASLPIAALPANKTVTLGFSYDSNSAKWVLLAADTIGY